MSDDSIKNQKRHCTVRRFALKSIYEEASRELGARFRSTGAVMKFVTFDRFAFVFLLLAASLTLTFVGTASFGQEPDSDPPQANRQTPPGTSGTKKKSKFPAPEIVELETKDGVKLTCTWFAPEGAGPPAKPVKNAAETKVQPPPAGKKTAPFILLHDWDRSREDLLSFGRFLQVAGHAVIVPDLRGHGGSLTVEGSDRPIDRERMRKKEMPSVLADLEACKKFLMRKNDAGVVNIDLLSVAAVGQTAILAMQWAVTDWSWTPVGSVKQGQDVKSLILIAPTQKFKGISIKPFFKHPLFVGGRVDPLPVLFVYAESHSDSVEDSTKIYQGIKKGRSRYAKQWRKIQAEQPDPEDGPQDPDEAEQEEDEPKVAPPPPPIDPMKTFIDAPVPRRNESGSQLISSPKSRSVFAYIDRYVKRTVLSRQAAYPWQKRLGK